MKGMAAIEFHDATSPPKVFKGANIFQARMNLLIKWVWILDYFIALMDVEVLKSEGYAYL